MKTFAVALLAASSSALSMEFISGAQKGIFLKSESQISDFKCQPAQVDQQVKKVLDIVPMMQMVAGTVKKGAKPSPMVNLVLDAVTSYGKISYLLDADYEGSDFCKGLLLAHEAHKIVMELGTTAVSKQSENMLQ